VQPNLTVETHRSIHALGGGSWEKRQVEIASAINRFSN